MWVPMNFDKINICSNYFQPSGIKVDSLYTDTFDRMLYERVCSILDITYKGTIDIDYFKYCLLSEVILSYNFVGHSSINCFSRI